MSKRPEAARKKKKPQRPQTQVAALCLDPEAGTVLLITSRDTGRWVIPKGWPMPKRSLPAAAAREAWEEAGVEGRIGTRELGRYGYDKRRDAGFAIPVEVRVYPMHVQSLAEQFPEAGQRRHGWFAPRDAAAQVHEAELAALIAGTEGRIPEILKSMKPRRT